MAQDKEDKLRKLIQSVDLDQPKADFTALLMQQIEAEDSLAVNPALDALIEKHLIESPSIDFTQHIMTSIERLDKRVVYEPIISKKVWYGIGIAAAFFIILVSFFGKSSQVGGEPLPLANNITQITELIITQINALPALVLACLFAVSALILIEYIVTDKKKFQV